MLFKISQSENNMHETHGKAARNDRGGEVTLQKTNLGLSRITWADTFRAVMIIFIAFGHSAKTGDFNKYVYSFHVPAFFFISGFFFRKTDLNFIRYAWKKFKSLMIPYYIFSIISIVLFAVLGSFASDKLDVAIRSSDIAPNIAGMLYANGLTGYMKWNLPLWFIPCLFATMLAAYPLEKWICAHCSNKIRAYLVVGLSALVLSVLNNRIAQFYALPFHLETLVFMMPFFVMPVRR